MKTGDVYAELWLEPKARGRSYCVAITSQRGCWRTGGRVTYEVRVERWQEQLDGSDAREVASFEGVAATWAGAERMGRRAADRMELEARGER